ncbi:hypothetical protein MTsPCn5_05710 [Croceitalea sp. MTPC5]|uniref:hypothetical protein n=1 Tax=Croceitalea sp. MTPC5 TaxID=3056565 RepID=UPI002B3F6049|nr:hypothetical protein MTsPCn5_05710 [Croceitalea sp. MTPC5]
MRTNLSTKWELLLLPTFFLILLLSSCSSSSSTEEVPPPLLNEPVDAKAVLFVGNSLTNNNSMAEMVRQMAFTTNRSLLYTLHAPGGTTIAEHASSTELEAKINSREWNFVSIQAQSFAFVQDTPFVENNVFPDVLTVVDKVSANNSFTIPLYYMTWGQKDGDETLCGPLPDYCTFEGMNGIIKENYLNIMNRTNGQVSPGAELWSVIRDRHPELDLYAFDGRHPSILGSYVIALSFYTMIFKADPTEVTWHRDELDAADEELLRDIVKEVVFDRISEWQAN